MFPHLPVWPVPHSVAIFSSKKRPGPATHKTDSLSILRTNPDCEMHGKWPMAHMEDLLPSSSIHLISLLLKQQHLSKSNLPNISHTPHTDKAWCHMIVVVWHLSEFGWKMWKCWAKRPWSQLLCEVGDVGVQECSSPVAALQPPVALCGSSTHRQFMSGLHCVARLIAEEVAPPAESPRPGHSQTSQLLPGS